MSAPREINAVVASVAVHVLVLAAFMLVREPARETPPTVILRLTLPAAGGAAPILSGTPEPVAGKAAGAAAPDRPAARSGALPALVTPRGSVATGALASPARTGPASVGTLALPDPGTALAGALAAAAGAAGPPAAAPTAVAPTAAESAAAATETLQPRLTRSGLPAVERGIALPYPPDLVRRGIEADVELRLTVAADGTVASAEVVRSSGVSSVDAEVAQALRQFLFASSGDTPVTGTIRVSYRLERGF